MTNGITTGQQQPIGFEKIDEKATDANIKIYESTRAEMIQRINLRDGGLLFYIASMGTYLNQAVSYHYSDTPAKVDFTKSMLLMVPLPFTCIIFSLLVLQHHLIIGRMGNFLRHEMNWGALASKMSPHWDNSATFLTQANLLIRLRLYGQGLVLVLPTVYFVAFFRRFYNVALTHGDLGINGIWGLAAINIVSATFIVWLHVDTHEKRKKDWETFPTFRDS